MLAAFHTPQTRKDGTMSHRSFTCGLRRWPILLALSLSIVVGSSGFAAEAGASPRGERPAASSTALTVGRPAPRATVAGGVGTLIAKLLQRIRFRGIAVIRRTAIKIPRYYTEAWLTNRFCSGWYRYFGYDVRTWRYYAYYYANARWAWNFCSTRRWYLVY
jgi:hypothetical protein